MLWNDEELVEFQIKIAAIEMGVLVEDLPEEVEDGLRKQAEEYPLVTEENIADYDLDIIVGKSGALLVYIDDIEGVNGDGV